VGTRAQIWTFNDESGFLDVSASTLYWDFYKRLVGGDGELAIGGGLAGTHLQIENQWVGRDSEFTGGGISLFAEGFYPLLRFPDTDVGVIGHARMAFVTPIEDDMSYDTVTMNDELRWGIELRRRFGYKQKKFWYVNVVREMQHWGSAQSLFERDQTFLGTAINFGLAW